jgi:hypothetical protein
MSRRANYGIVSLQENYLAWRKKFVIVPAWREKFEKIPAWRDKVGIVLMLINPVWRESLGIILIPHDGRRM